MIITAIETFPLRIPLKAGSKSDACAWGELQTSPNAGNRPKC